MRRPVVAAVVAAALVAGGAAGWAREVHDDAAAAARSRDRVASAVVAGAHDDTAAALQASRSSDLVGRGLLGDSVTALADAIPPAQAVLDGSAGRVADEAGRGALAEVIALARQAVAESAAPARADELAVRLTSASADVLAAQRAWEAAAAAAARTSPTSKAPARATPMPVDSCKSTYTGPSFYTSVPSPTGSGANGDMPTSAMTELTWAGPDPHGNGYWLRTDAAAALTRLNTAFEAAFGHHLDLDLAYRDLKTQHDMFEALGPKVAAPVGQSNHGKGTAIDVPELPCEYGLHTPQRDWLVAHGPSYGWYALSGEYWHFDFRG